MTRWHIDLSGTRFICTWIHLLPIHSLLCDSPHVHSKNGSAGLWLLPGTIEWGRRDFKTETWTEKEGGLSQRKQVSQNSKELVGRRGRRRERGTILSGDWRRVWGSGMWEPLGQLRGGKNWSVQEGMWKVFLAYKLVSLKFIQKCK